MKIHPTAIISPKVEINHAVEIGPYCVIEEGVRIKKGTKIFPYVHIKGKTTVGENNLIHTGCVIGEKPQMLGLRENVGSLKIGDNNIVREYVTIHTSTKEDTETIIGNNNYLMGFSHIAHDCNLGNDIVICNGSLIAGHVQIQDKAFISGNVVVHQFVRIGRLSMIAGLSRVNQDVPPFMMLVGNSKIWGINTVGLKRAQILNEEIKKIKKAFSVLYCEGLPLNKSIEKLSQLNSPYVNEIIEFIKNSQRGISGPNRPNLLEKIFLDYPLLMRHNIATYRLFKKKNLGLSYFL